MMEETQINFIVKAKSPQEIYLNLLIKNTKWKNYMIIKILLIQMLI